MSSVEHLLYHQFASGFQAGYDSAREDGMRKAMGLGLAAAAMFLLAADWDLGGGIFGKWVKDPYGLAAY